MEDRREREREGVTESKREREFTQYKSVPMISKMGSKCLSHKCGVFQEYILLFLRVIPVQGMCVELGRRTYSFSRLCKSTFNYIMTENSIFVKDMCFWEIASLCEKINPDSSFLVEILG
jgi:hypothetical protein